jgi:hypothetical protein
MPWIAMLKEEAHVLRADQPLFDPHHPAVLDPGKPDGTGAGPLLVGGFEIDGDGLQGNVPDALAPLLSTPGRFGKGRGVSGAAKF